MKKNLLIWLMLIIGIYANGQVLIDTGSNWKYLDDGSNQGTSWRNPSYNDASWSSGNAQLGYGDGDENTVISYGSNSNDKHITYYFRKQINVTNPSQQPNLKLRILRDDGAVVYINGTEVARSNMPTGTIYYNTFAAHTVSGSDENAYFEYIIPSSSLVTGQNIVAVEVHQRTSTSSDCSFNLKLEFSNEEVNLYRKAPYVLYSGENTEMLIVWQLNETGTCEFKWGTDTNYTSGTLTSSEYGSDHQHKVELTNLQVSTKYYYSVNYNNSVKTGSFRSGAADNETQVSFYAYGDTRSYPSDHDDVAQCLRTKLNNFPESQTFILSSGDLVSNGNNETDWDEQFFSPNYDNIQYMLGNLPYVATVGNHEGSGALFGKYFPYSMYESSSAYYYSFDYANVHIVVIDQYINYSSGSAQYNWLVNDLSTSTKPWKFIMLHEPGWSAGGHSNNYDVQNIIQPLCETYNVQFVISGHNHYYSRAVVNGVNHVTTGGGGAPLYSPNASASNIVTVDESHHYCKIDINNNMLTFTAIRDNCSVIESFNVTTTVAVNNISDNKLNVSVYNLQDGIIINNKENKPILLSVYDNIGRLVQTEKLQLEDNKIQINGKGIYLLKLSSDDGKIFVKKVFVNN